MRDGPRLMHDINIGRMQDIKTAVCRVDLTNIEQSSGFQDRQLESTTGSKNQQDGATKADSLSGRGQSVRIYGFLRDKGMFFESGQLSPSLDMSTFLEDICWLLVGPDVAVGVAIIRFDDLSDKIS